MLKKGFYLSADRKQAVGMAEQKLNQIKQGSVYVSTFLFDESVMTSGELKVKIFDDYSEEWVNFILANRSYELSLGRLIAELRYPKGITFQYFFGTERALTYLKRI